MMISPSCYLLYLLSCFAFVELASCLIYAPALLEYVIIMDGNSRGEAVFRPGDFELCVRQYLHSKPGCCAS